MNETEKRFYGKYRGIVTDNRDPNMLGQVRARVPDVWKDGEVTGWAKPCVPYAGDGVGLFLIPPVGASVWIEFERGETESPIWTGCFWEQGEMPLTPATPEKKMLKTGVGTITIDDTSGRGGITIETTDGKKVVLNGERIEIKDDKWNIKIEGKGVLINDGALEVT